MSVTRRQFLLSTAGAAVGAVVPSFYFQALEFFERFEQPLLVPPERVSQDLVVAIVGERPELFLGDPWEGPPNLTWRQYLERYEPNGLGAWIDDGRLQPEELDIPVDHDSGWDLWGTRHGPAARAYHLLKSLDLGPALSGPDAVGGLDLSEEFNFAGWHWLAVYPDDGITLSLLQQRLNDLGTGIRLVTECAV